MASAEAMVADASASVVLAAASGREMRAATSAYDKAATGSECRDDDVKARATVVIFPPVAEKHLARPRQTMHWRDVVATTGVRVRQNANFELHRRRHSRHGDVIAKCSQCRRVENIFVEGLSMVLFDVLDVLSAVFNQPSDCKSPHFGMA